MPLFFVAKCKAYPKGIASLFFVVCLPTHLFHDILHSLFFCCALLFENGTCLFSPWLPVGRSRRRVSLVFFFWGRSFGWRSSTGSFSLLPNFFERHFFVRNPDHQHKGKKEPIDCPVLLSNFLHFFNLCFLFQTCTASLSSPPCLSGGMDFWRKKKKKKETRPKHVFFARGKKRDRHALKKERDTGANACVGFFSSCSASSRRQRSIAHPRATTMTMAEQCQRLERLGDAKGVKGVAGSRVLAIADAPIDPPVDDGRRRDDGSARRILPQDGTGSSVEGKHGG